MYVIDPPAYTFPTDLYGSHHNMHEPIVQAAAGQESSQDAPLSQSSSKSDWAFNWSHRCPDESQTSTVLDWKGVAVGNTTSVAVARGAHDVYVYRPATGYTPNNLNGAMAFAAVATNIDATIVATAVAGGSIWLSFNLLVSFATSYSDFYVVVLLTMHRP